MKKLIAITMLCLSIGCASATPKANMTEAEAKAKADHEEQISEEIGSDLFIESVILGIRQIFLF